MMTVMWRHWFRKLSTYTGVGAACRVFSWSGWWITWWWYVDVALHCRPPPAESDKLARRAKAAGWPGVAGLLLIGRPSYACMHACMLWLHCTAVHGTWSDRTMSLWSVYNCIYSAGSISDHTQRLIYPSHGHELASIIITRHIWYPLLIDTTDGSYMDGCICKRVLCGFVPFSLVPYVRASGRPSHAGRVGLAGVWLPPSSRVWTGHGAANS
jgi:hypothetical protein